MRDGIADGRRPRSRHLNIRTLDYAGGQRRSGSGCGTSCLIARARAASGPRHRGSCRERRQIGSGLSNRAGSNNAHQEGDDQQQCESDANDSEHQRRSGTPFALGY